jgi:hypothetical protein
LTALHALATRVMRRITDSVKWRVRSLVSGMVEDLFEMEGN